MAGNERHYEMLWNCEVCKTDGLLAKSQRHCPSCGAAQDPAKRYFPEPGQEVEVSGHRFVGADWRCAYCESPNSAAARHCGNCGAGQDGTKPVATVVDPLAVAEAPPAPAQEASKKGGFGRWIVAAVLGVLAVVGTMFFSTKEATVEVGQRTWQREIRIERMAAVSESAWCDSLPGGAYAVTRSREVRSHKQVAAGQECRETRVDKGDGTFVKNQECKPKYREEPVYDERCAFRVNRWQTVRSVRADSQNSPVPNWPLVGSLQAVGGSVLGAEREGGRSERYTLNLAADGKTWSCDVAPAVWEKYKPGSRVPIKLRMTGGADCGSLQ